VGKKHRQKNISEKKVGPWETTYERGEEKDKVGSNTETFPKRWQGVKPRLTKTKKKGVQYRPPQT